MRYSNNLKWFKIEGQILYMGVAIMAISLITSYTVVNVFAQPPTSGYKSSADCHTKYIGGKVTQTCCYRTPGKTTLGDTYCQTCILNSDLQPTNCDQPELQFRSTSGNVPNNDDNGNGGVLKDSGISNKGTNDKMPMGGVLTNQQ